MQAAEFSGGTKFRVTAEDVRRLYFTDDMSHGGKVPVRATSAGTIDEEGWLWKKVVGQAAPPMSATLADQLHERIECDSDPLFLVVAPSGAGKSYGAWQLGTRRYVDLLDASCNKASLFSKWRRTVEENKLDDALVLMRGETVASVGRPKLNSRKAVYHAWILLCALTAMRAQCAGPSDWLSCSATAPAGFVLATQSRWQWPRSIGCTTKRWQIWLIWACFMGRKRYWWWMKLRTRCTRSMIQRLRRSEPRLLHPCQGTPLVVASEVPLHVHLAVALAEVLGLALAARPSAMARRRVRGCWGAFCKRRCL